MNTHRAIRLIAFVLAYAATYHEGFAAERYFVFEGGTVLSEIRPIELRGNHLVYFHLRKMIDSVAVDSLVELSDYGSFKNVHGAVIGLAAGLVIGDIVTPRETGAGFNPVPLVVIVGCGAVGAVLGTVITERTRSPQLYDFSGKSAGEKKELLQHILF
jgi:hypothetical protein